MTCLFRASLALACIALGACTSTPSPPFASAPTTQAARVRFEPVPYSSLPGWSADAFASAWPAWQAACAALQSPARTVPALEKPCLEARTVDATSATAIRKFFEGEFTPYRMSTADGRDTGLVTGYYEPLLRGSRSRHGPFQTPLHAVPDDLLSIDLGDAYPEMRGKRLRGRVEGRRVVPYWSRAAITAGSVPLRDNALVYVDDPLQAFFMEVQGSGRIALDDGGILRLGYADQNGLPYRAIGRVLADRGELKLEDVSLQSITRWAREHPDQVPALMNENPSYVFFHEAASGARSQGPVGALGAPLTAERSIAVDAATIPLGAPVFLSARRPSTSAPLAHLMFAQDTGGAIRGPLRADLFWGTGAAAEEEAGRMKEPGRFWLLWPRGTAPPGT